MKQIRRYAFPVLITLTALAVSTSAAFYSVSGLSKLFAGASTEVIIMTGSLEVAKLVIASLLYRYWDSINKVLRIYLVVATTILVLITSMGIYGFLSAAYQNTANQLEVVDNQIGLLESRKTGYSEQLAIYNTEKKELSESIQTLRTGLVTNKLQYVDKNGNTVTTTSKGTRQALEKQLNDATSREKEVTAKVDELTGKVYSTTEEVAEVRSASTVASEVGPLKYLSTLFDIPMNRIINWLLLVIIFVFDPLAISLVIAASFAFEQAKPKENLYGEIENNFREWDNLEVVAEEVAPVPSMSKQEFKDTLDKVSKIVAENDNKIVNVVQKGPTKWRVEHEDGTVDWQPKEKVKDEMQNKKRYL